MTILYIYITLFSIYYIVLACTNIKKSKKVRDKYTLNDKNLCVVVYANGKVKTLDNLIKQLKNQDYTKQHYTIYAILDKCEEEIDVTLQTDLEVNVIPINNLEPIGKSQAYSILAEKLSDVPNLDAFVFLDAKNYVNTDFLSSVNYYLTKYNVFIPMVNFIPEDKDFTLLENIKSSFSRYCFKFLYASRTKLNLTNLINTDAFVIKKELLNRIGSFEFQDKTAEIKYTLKLANEGERVAYINDLKVYTGISNYDSRVPSLSKRIGIFWNNFTHAPNLLTQEYVCSLIQPNWLVLILGYAILLRHSYAFPFWVNYTAILITFITVVLAFCSSLMCTKFYSNELWYLFAYPIYSFCHIMKNLPPVRWVRKILDKKNYVHSIEKMTVDVIVTDGKQDFPCQMELISDNGLARVKFINKNKTYTTKNNHLRMIDAVRELSAKLNDYGLSLKICQNCKYFEHIVDGSTNMIKGCCNCKFQGRVEGDIIPSLIWNTCPRFEENNVIPLF